jgi:hypothetical protein
MSAVQVDTGTTDPWWVAPARRRQKKIFILIVAGTFALQIPMFAVLHLMQRAPAHPRHHSSLLVLVLIVLAAVVFLAVYIGALLLLQKRGVKWLQPQPILALGWRSRRRILKALRRGVPLTDENSREGEIAVLSAHRLRRRKTAVAMWVVSVLLGADLLYLAIFQGSARWLWLGYGALLVVVFGSQWRLRAGAARYLAASSRSDARPPDQGPSGQAKPGSAAG